MKVVQKESLAAASECKGVVVVIDVLRAFTTAAFAFSKGASAILLVGEVEEAFALRKKTPELLLAGEVDGRPIEGFDFGNSPDDIAKADLKGKRLVLRSSSGTQGVVGAVNAESVFLGSLPVARATASYLLKHRKPELVTLLAAGSQMRGAEEDVACSDYLAGLLGASGISAEEAVKRVRDSEGGRQAVDPKVDWMSPADLECACAVNKFRYAMEVKKEYGLLTARPLPVPMPNL